MGITADVDIDDNVTIKGGTDGTNIGNTGDSLNTFVKNDEFNPVVLDSYTKGAFGESSIVQQKPYVAIDAISGVFNPLEIERFNNGTGSAAGINDNNPGKEFKVVSGTSIGGYGVLRTKKTLTYRPGIGSLGRFSARFSTPVALSIQRAGFQNIGNELAFGYNGTVFGILHRTGGRPEIRRLTITTSSNLNTNVTITLNGTAKVIAVTNASASVNAFEIASAYSTTDGWSAYSIEETIIFQSQSVDAKSGTYSAVPASGNFAGTFTQITAGASVVDNHIPQSTWNGTTLETEDDPFIIDPLKGNVYQVQYQYLGYGAISFGIENPNSSRIITVHTIRYANSNTSPSLDLPSFKLGIIAASLGTTTSVEVHSGSMAGFHENAFKEQRLVSAAFGENTGVSTIQKNVLALKKITIADEAFIVSDILIEEVTAASEGTKPVIFSILLNPTFADDLIWEDSGTNTPVLKTSTGGTVTNGRLLYSISLSKSSNVAISLHELEYTMTNDDIISIAARATSGNTDTTATAIWGGR